MKIPPIIALQNQKKIPIIINPHKHTQKSRACMYMQIHIEHDHTKNPQILHSSQTTKSTNTYNNHTQIHTTQTIGA